MTFTKPADWNYATDEEIATAIGLGAEILNDDAAYIQAIANMANVFDMMVQGPDGSNMNIMYENLTVSNSLSMTEEEYLQTLESMLGAMTEVAYQVSDEITTVQLGDQTYYLLTATVDYAGVQMTQGYYVRRVGDYICAAIATVIGDTTLEQIQACFS